MKTEQINVSRITERLTQLRQQRESAVSTVQALSGAIAVLEELLNSEPPKVEPPKA